MVKNFKLRAVITALDAGYVVSISKMSDDGDITILGEEEVGSVADAHRFMAEIAATSSYPVSDIGTLYNIDGDITVEPPPGLA